MGEGRYIYCLRIRKELGHLLDARLHQQYESMYSRFKNKAADRRAYHYAKIAKNVDLNVPFSRYRRRMHLPLLPSSQDPPVQPIGLGMLITPSPASTIEAIAKSFEFADLEIS